MERFEVYGDSIRAGFRIEDKPYVEKLFKDKLINYSFNGATVYDMLDIAYNKSEKIPALAIVGIGVNDLIQGRDPDQVGERILRLVERLKELEKIVVVEAIIPVEKYYFLSLHDFTEEEINRKINKLNHILGGNSQEKEYYFLKYAFTKEEFSKRDGVHPDIKGNNQLYRQLKDYLQNNNLI